MNRTLMDKVQTKFVETKLPRHLWGEAIYSSAYEMNRCPTSANLGKSPASIWYGKNDIGKLRVFGSKAWKVNTNNKNKLDLRAKPVIMVGYCGGGYRLWDPEENKIISSRDVIFDELHIKYEEAKPTYMKIRMEDQEENSKESENTKVYSKRNNEVEDKNNDEDKESYSKSDNEDDDDNEYKDEDLKISKSTKTGRQVKRPSYLDEYELYSAYCLLMGNEDPKSYEEAIKNKEWKEAINKELKSHEKLKTWKISKLPHAETVIDTKWVFHTKEDGTKKARLVAKGFQVKLEDSLNPMYAPVARIATIRMLLAHAVQNDWNIRQMDIPTAFLNGKLESEIYIKIPEGLKADKGSFVYL